MSQSEAARRVEAMADALRASGLRLTHRRLQVVREIAGTDEHPDVETIYRRARRRVPTISLDTVYRSLGVLADLGLIARFTGAGGPTRYDPNLSRHHHFVCTRCGLVRDVAGDMSDLPPPADIALMGTVESVQVQFKGICAHCAARVAAPAGDKNPHRPASRGSGTSHRKECHR